MWIDILLERGTSYKSIRGIVCEVVQVAMHI